MSSGDYEQFIIQKCRLAVAIAVLKSKPKNVSIEEYLSQLKANINETNTISDDITICESDFDFDENDSVINDFDDNDSDNSVTLLKNFDFNSLGDTVSKPTDTNSLISVMRMVDNEDDAGIKIINTNNSQSTYFEGSENSQNNFIANIINDDIQISDDLRNNEKENKCINSNKVTPSISNKLDSQETEIYTLHGYTDCNTHISQSQNNFVISKNLIHKTKDFKTKAISQSLNKNIQVNKHITNNVIDENNVTNNNVCETTKTNDKRKVNLIIDGNVKNKRMKIDLKTPQNNVNDSETQFSSQSASDKTIDHINDLFDFDSFNINSVMNSEIGNNQLIQATPNISNFGNSINNQEINTTKSKDISLEANSYSFIEFEYNTESQTFSSNNLTTNKPNKESQDDFTKKQNEKTKSITNTDIIKDVINAKTGFDKNESPNIDLFDKTKEYTNDNNSNGSSGEITDLTASQVEIVSFKILEELSKIKNYLNRRERANKSDSGYKSFQRRNSGDSASQCSGLWINESAHCLMDFITTSPLVMSTADITDEISKVLGKLIDQLHEDEIYPKFLEEILETVDKLLTNAYEGRNYGENILTKDDVIHRLFLLNRSSHIIKYSIEKIIAILENVLTNLNDTFEILNTDKSENICYIFYILEDLLKRYNRYKILSSQNSSQPSQDERILKKSSLTEIWRKKWNLSKIDVCEGTLEKKCVLTKCSEVLNKIIVQAMEGYSLISYAALQCFNLLQN